MCPDPDTRPPAEKPHVGFFELPDLEALPDACTPHGGATHRGALCAVYFARRSPTWDARLLAPRCVPDPDTPDREKPHVGFLNSQIS